SEIVSAIYSRIGGFSKKEAADLVDLVFETMKETLGRGEKIKISGFGNFVLRDKRQRRGRNPQTGEPLTIDERRVLTFKPSPILKAALNGGVDPDPNDEHGAEEDQTPAPRHATTQVSVASTAPRRADRDQAR